MVSDGIETKTLKRALRVGGLGFRVTGSYLNYQFQNLFLSAESRERNRESFHRNNARRVCEELQDLRGPIMKLGQALSMQTQQIPPEIIEELAELQMHAPPMHATLMRTQFKKALGKYPEDVFQRFDMEPFAAASLGQVHRAVTESGEEVAVKIQYPAIRQAIKNDFALLRTATLPAQWAKYVPADMLKEAEDGIMKETDYLNEAHNIEHFRECLSGLPFVRVPRVFPEYSSEKVLTMSFMPGEFLEYHLARNPGEGWINLVGERLYELYLFQWFNIEGVHADPHPGNYLFDDEGNITLIDFGCVKYFSEEVTECGRRMADSLWEGDEREFADALRMVFRGQLDVDDPRSQPVLEAFSEFFGHTMPTKDQRKPVDFGEAEVLERMLNIWDKSLRASVPNPEMFFLCRAELGLLNTLNRLGARIVTTDVARRVRSGREGA